MHPDITLGHLTVVPFSLSTVLLEWKVIPSDGHHCITSYNIQVSGRDGSQWGAQTPGRNHSFLLSGMQLEPLEEYTYCVTVNIPSTQTGPFKNVSPSVKQTSIVIFQGMHHKSYSPCRWWLCSFYCLMLGYNSTMHTYIQNLTLQLTSLLWWLVAVKVIKSRLNGRYTVLTQNQQHRMILIYLLQAPPPAPLRSALTGYLLHYHSYDEDHTIQLPLNATSTSYMLNNVTICVFNITVAALSETGPSRNNPSVRLGM